MKKKSGLTKDDLLSEFEAICTQFVVLPNPEEADNSYQISPEINTILNDFINMARNVSHSKTGRPEKIFEMAKADQYPEVIAELAESFGMMVVKIEAHEMQLEKSIRELKQLKEELEYKNKELTAKVMQMSEQKTQIRQSLNQFQGLNVNDINEYKKNVRNIFNTISNIIESAPDWDEFESYFLEVSDEFYKRLYKKHPDLTQREIRLCAFLKLKMNTKEIANLTNLSVKTIEVYRNRLRKKLALAISSNLVNYICNI